MSKWVSLSERRWVSLSERHSLWIIDGPGRVREFARIQFGVWHKAVSPLGDMVYLDRTIDRPPSLWRVEGEEVTAGPLLQMGTDTRWRYGAVFSPDGKKLLTVLSW